MEIFLINEDHPDCKGLVKKLCNIKDGALIPLTKGELDLYRSDDTQIVSFGTPDGVMNISEVEPGKHYLISADDKRTNLKDLIYACDKLGITYGIVRTKDYGRA